jgi:hypothetical protein
MLPVALRELRSLARLGDAMFGQQHRRFGAQPLVTFQETSPRLIEPGAGSRGVPSEAGLEIGDLRRDAGSQGGDGVEDGTGTVEESFGGLPIALVKRPQVREAPSCRITPAAIFVVVLSSGPYRATVPMRYCGC